MNIFGVGGWELLLIVLIALIVAGPKRLAIWAYQLGQWTAKFQNMWGEFAATLQAEMDEAGVNVEIPTTPPTRQDLARSVQKIGHDIVKSAEQPLEEVKEEVKSFGTQINAESNAISRGINGSPRADLSRRATSPPPTTESPDDDTSEDEKEPENDLGTWGGD